ncbi:acyl carrier protein [Streptomyces sp. NPDC086023]|uniref:acyl carrier protein n=1 Tax=Streptomyces sp. NPDC086023 TaxID=3365746 RepID=UPI0037CD4FD3
MGTTTLGSAVAAVIEFVQGVTPVDITDGDVLHLNLLHDLGVDPDNTVKLVMALEQQFAITVPYTDAYQVYTIGEIARLVVDLAPQAEDITDEEDADH